ncbi:MAG: hypothetical protein AAFQ43_06875 [Bacteroidota bacterium]
MARTTTRVGVSDRNRTRQRPLALALALVVASGVAVGCGDTFVDPFIRDQGSFSLYGVLISEGSPAPQRVRVQVVRTLPDPPTDPDDPAIRFPVQVTSEIEGRISSAWDSSHVRLDDGTYGAIFADTFRPEPGQTITLRARRDTDGAEATAEVIVPPIPRATAPPAVIDGADVTQTVAWDSRVLWVQVRYFVYHESIGRFEAIAPVYALPADGVFTLDMVRDRELCVQALRDHGEEFPEDVLLSRVEVQILGTQETAWPTLPDADAEAAQPGAYSNVTGGYGLVVAATRGTIGFRPDRKAAVAAGFRPSY